MQLLSIPVWSFDEQIGSMQVKNVSFGDGEK